jgi:hypothetical protein
LRGEAAELAGRAAKVGDLPGVGAQLGLEPKGVPLEPLSVGNQAGGAANGGAGGVAMPKAGEQAGPGG